MTGTAAAAPICRRQSAGHKEVQSAIWGTWRTGASLLHAKSRTTKKQPRRRWRRRRLRRKQQQQQPQDQQQRSGSRWIEGGGTTSYIKPATVLPAGADVS